MLDTEKAKKHREYNYAWAERNKERVTRRRRELYQLNKEKINQQRREYWAKHREQKKEADKRYYTKNKLQMNKYGRERHRQREDEFVAKYKKGKSCALCGYNEHYEILEFHHKDKQKKLFEITIFKTAKKSPEEIQAEINKCILICPNCHFLIHQREKEGKWIEIK